MSDVRKLCARGGWPLLMVFAASAALVMGMGQRKSGSADAVPLDDWDIPRLAAYLNDKGLALRPMATRKGGSLSESAVYLTTTDKGWDDLNRLAKNPQWIDLWRGTLYCERNPDGDYLLRRWGEYSLGARPFLFYGDPELLARVRDALAPLVSSVR